MWKRKWESTKAKSHEDVETEVKKREKEPASNGHS